MASKTIIWLMFHVSFLLFFIQGTLSMKNSRRDPHSLEDFIHDYAQKVIQYPRTGTIYNLSLPSNYSGIEASFVRLRSASLYIRGTNSSLFHIPPRMVTLPYVKRLDIVYQNLGNWSSYYYNVPNYTFVTPVIGFTTYNSDTNSSMSLNPILNLSLRGEDPILVRFPKLSLEEGENVTMKCVTFDAYGTFKFSNVTAPNLCTIRDQGYFSIVVPSLKPSWEKGKRKIWKRWAIGCGIGVGGLILVILVGISVCKLIKHKRIKGMERQSQKSEALDTIWIGRSKMPSASGIRTQPALENDYIP